MASRYKTPVGTTLSLIHQSISQNTFMQSAPRAHITRIIKPTNARKMSLLFPRFAYTPVRCGPVRHEVAPLWSLFDDTINELQRASRQSSRRQWNPRFDVKETKEAYSLEGELPGVDQKDINIEFTDEHTLTIKGRHSRTTERGSRPTTPAAEDQQAIGAAHEDGTATPSSTKSSHHATVEDDAEEPANASAATEQPEAGAAPQQEVAAPKQQQPKKPAEQFWYRERSVGEFTRSFAFPSRVDQEAVRASLKNGVLSIVVPKAAAPESRRINIE